MIMANWVKNQSAAAWVSIFAGVMAIVGLIIYIVNSTTGYLGSTQMNALPVVFTILAVLLIAAMVAAGSKASHWVSYIIHPYRRRGRPVVHPRHGYARKGRLPQRLHRRRRVLRHLHAGRHRVGIHGQFHERQIT